MKRFVCVIVTLCICASILLCGCGVNENQSMPRESISFVISLYTDICNDGELYIDKNLGSVPLGVTEDDIDAAIDDYEALRRYP